MPLSNDRGFQTPLRTAGIAGKKQQPVCHNAIFHQVPYNVGECAKGAGIYIKSQLLKLAFYMAPGNV